MKSTFCLILGSAFLFGALTAQTTLDPWLEGEENWHDDYPGHGHGEFMTDDPSSPGGVTDGNPNASTAFVAQEVAQSGALLNESEATEVNEGTTEAAAPAALDLDFGAGSGKIDGTDFNLFTVRLPYSHDVSERGQLKILMPLSFTRIKDVVVDANGLRTGDASVYGGGFNASYRHKVIAKADGKPYRWNVTPSAGLFLRESSDLNQGAWVYNVGLSSSFAHRFNENWVLNLGNSLTLAWNSGRKNFPDPIRDNQQVLINGLQVFYLDGRWTHHAYLTDTRFLRNSFTDNFQTIGAGTSFRVTRTRTLRASAVYETGSRYEAFRVMLGSSWSF